MTVRSETSYTVDENTRVICGNFQYRRFAYVHKVFQNRLGLLQACDMKNARSHLGKDFLIRETWLSSDEEESVGFDAERRREIVASVFHELVIPKSTEIEHLSKVIEPKKENTISESERIRQLEERVAELERVLFVVIKEEVKITEIKNPWADKTEQKQKAERILRIVADAGNVIPVHELTRKTQWIKIQERKEILDQLKDSGLLFEGIRRTQGREARVLAKSIPDLEQHGFTPHLIGSVANV